jgi:hypothetical protein
MEGHRRKVVGVSIASVAALLIKISPLLVGSTLSIYVAWWLYRHGRYKKS